MWVRRFSNGFAAGVGFGLGWCRAGTRAFVCLPIIQGIQKNVLSALGRYLHKKLTKAQKQKRKGYKRVAQMQKEEEGKNGNRNECESKMAEI